MTTPKLELPLRAENTGPSNMPLIVKDARGKTVAACPDQQTADLIVGIVNGQEKGISKSREAHLLHVSKVWMKRYYELKNSKAALAAGGSA